MGVMNGLSLFSGYGGIDLALSEWVRPILYCEIETYAQAILLSRMDDATIPFAPIWNDVTTLDGRKFRGLVDIVSGGFPCQDISVAGKGAGLEGKRSGLFYEVARLIEDIKPSYVFLENVPAIRTRGAIEVQETLSGLGYDSRWLTLSAAEVGANHKRERWFCLASNSNSDIVWDKSNELTKRKGTCFIGHNGEKESMANPYGTRLEGAMRSKPENSVSTFSSKEVADPNLQRRSGEPTSGSEENNQRIGESDGRSMPSPFDSSWWEVEPDVGRVANGVEFRPHRIKALGNGVVPLQVRTAFKELMGIK